MPRDITALTNALEETTAGSQSDVYTVLAAWNQSIDAALERGGGSRFRDVMSQYCPQVIDLVDVAAATGDGVEDGADVDWTFLQECVEAYPPGVGDHHSSAVLANVIARDVIRTRITQSPAAIPKWVIDYLQGITMEEDTEWAWESALAVGWGVGHPDVAVLDQVVERAETDNESWSMGVLRHVAFADPDAAITLLERLLRSPAITEDLRYLRSLEPPLDGDFPDVPQYWEPHTELEYSATVTDEQRERLVSLLGDTVNANRLRKFDEQFAFDLRRAAEKSGSDAADRTSTDDPTPDTKDGSKQSSLGEYERQVSEEISATLQRAAFETLSHDSFRIEVTDSFQRKLGDCRPLTESDGNRGESATGSYLIRIARRLFDTDRDADWRDVVRHEVAHAYVISAFGRDGRPHGEEWKDAARRAGADPTARYEVDSLVNADYVLGCPEGCFQRGYLQRSKRIKYPWQYACGECETRLVSYDAADSPSPLEPGTCYVRSIAWETEEDLDGTTTAQSAPYRLACPNGCVEQPYQKRSKRIKFPWLYACPECETKLVSCDGADSPSSFEPGTCNVESIQWDEPQVMHACPNGCFAVGYVRHTDQTLDPDQYKCEKCETKTVSYLAGQRPATLTPGSNYTDTDIDIGIDPELETD